MLTHCVVNTSLLGVYAALDNVKGQLCTLAMQLGQNPAVCHQLLSVELRQLCGDYCTA